MPPTKDRRRFARIPFNAEVTLGIGTESLSGKLIDISLKGVLVTCPQGWVSPRDRLVTVEISAPDNAFTISMKGVVEHQDSDKLGIECREIDIDSATRLRRLVELNLGDTALLNRELAELADSTHLRGTE